MSPVDLRCEQHNDYSSGRGNNIAHGFHSFRLVFPKFPLGSMPASTGANLSKLLGKNCAFIAPKALLNVVHNWPNFL